MLFKTRNTFKYSKFKISNSYTISLQRNSDLKIRDIFVSYKVWITIWMLWRTMD